MPSLTASKRLTCFTRKKLFDKSGVRVAAVRAATADPVSGSTPADRSSAGKMNRKLPFSNLSSAISLRRTRRSCPSFTHTRSTLGESDNMLSNSPTPVTGSLTILTPEPWLPPNGMISRSFSALSYPAARPNFRQVTGVLLRERNQAVTMWNGCRFVYRGKIFRYLQAHFHRRSRYIWNTSVVRKLPGSDHRVTPVSLVYYTTPFRELSIC